MSTVILREPGPAPTAPLLAVQVERLPWGAATRLAAAQLISWGIFYYAFAMLVRPMQTELGWSLPLINGGLTVSLLVSSFCAVPVGRWLHRAGGRKVMSLGTLAGVAGLLLWAGASHLVVYLTAWAFLGFAFATTLYEAAFAVAAASFGPGYRRGIAFITFAAGFASTVFLPLTAWLAEGLSWRGALLTLAAVQLATVLPLSLFGLPARQTAPADVAAASPSRSAPHVASVGLHPWRKGAFRGLALCFTAYALGFSGLVFQLVPILQAQGVEMATLLQSLALIGPMKVLGRFAITAWPRPPSLRVLGLATLGAAIVAALLLACLPPTGLALTAFAVLYGMSDGTMTILRGTAVGDLLGRDRYAERNGALSLPSTMAKAAGPVALAGLATLTGFGEMVFVAAACLAMAAMAGFWQATRT